LKDWTKENEVNNETVKFSRVTFVLRSKLKRGIRKFLDNMDKIEN
jgi:hypothetical protein